MSIVIPFTSNARSIVLVATAVLCFLGLRASAGVPETPDLYFIVEPRDGGPPACFQTQERVRARVHVGPAASRISGAQFRVEYDPDCLNFVNVSPAGEPFTQPLATVVDEDEGWVFFAVGIELGDVGPYGEADLAVLEFKKSASCQDCLLCFGDVNPYHTYLSDEVGQPVLVVPQCSDSIHAAPELSISVPQPVTPEVGCGVASADLWWGPPAASASCGDVTLSCGGEHESGFVFDEDTVLFGGRLPVGLSTFCCSASGACEQTREQCWTVWLRDPDSFLHAQPDAAGVDKNRFISLQVDTEGRPAAIRVTLSRLYNEEHCPPRGPDLVDLSQFDGATRWVGPPFEVSETQGDERPTFLAARMQCCPYFADWTALLQGRLLNVLGPEVLPCSEYEVELVSGCCEAAPNDPACGTAPLTLTTARWGDVTDPMGAASAPNFQDISAGVDKFKRVPFDPGPPPTGALSKTRTMLRGNDLEVHTQVNFLDIGCTVNAFKNVPYREPGPTACTEPCP